MRCAWWTLLVLTLAVGGCGQRDADQGETTTDELPGDGDSRVDIAMTLLEEGDVSAGLDQLRQVEALEPNGELPAWFDEALGHLLQYRALAEVDSLLKFTGPLESRSPKYLYYSANVVQMRGLPDESVDLYERVQGDTEYEVQSALRIAMILRAQERFEDSLAAARRGLALSAEEELRNISAANLLDLDRAEEALAEAELLPPTVTRRTIEGGALLALGMPDSAAAVLRQAIRVNPRSPRIRYLLGRSYLAAENYNPAVQLLLQLAQAVPPYDDSHFYLAQALRGQGREEEAQVVDKEYERILSERKLAELRIKGLQASHNGNLDEALGWFEQANELAPDDGNLYNDMATALARLERYDEAEAALMKARDLRPDDRAVYANFITLYELTGNEEGVEEARAKLAELSETPSPDGN